MRFTRTHRVALAACALLVAYVASLLLWVGGSSSHRSISLPPVATPSQSVSSAAPSASRSAPSASASPGNVISMLNASLPDSSISANYAGLPRRAVRIEVTSDGEIAAFAYKVANGDPARYAANWLQSPIVVVNTGRSGGLVAAMIAEVGPTATYVTCTVTVDGVVRSRNTVHGAYKFTACLG